MKADLRNVDWRSLWRGLIGRDGSVAGRIVPSTGFTAQLTLLTAAAMAFLAVCVTFRQYRIILSADTASEVRQLLSQKRR